jgi:hypothetical protein
MLVGDNAGGIADQGAEDGLEITIRQPLQIQPHHQPRLGPRTPLIAGHDLGLEPIRADSFRHIADARQANLHRAHPDSNRSLGQVPVAIAAVLVRPLIPATAKELVDFLFEHGLEHLASSLADHRLEQVVLARGLAHWVAEPDTVWTRRNPS